MIVFPDVLKILINEPRFRSVYFEHILLTYQQNGSTYNNKKVGAAN